MKLRPYQEKIINEARIAFRDGHKAVLIQSATGSGKTVTGGTMIGGAAERGNRSWFIVNRRELLDQTAETFMALGIPFGIIAAGYSPNPMAMVQIASIDTLKNRLDKVRPPKLIVWDECRSLGAAGWTNVYNAFPDARHLGLDATPVRLDGKGLGAYFSHMVQGPKYSELMALGNLVPFDCYAPSAPDMSGLRRKGNDIDKEQAEAMFDKPSLVGDVVEHYKQLAMGKRGITFAVSVKHSQHLAESYRAAGIPAVHLDGETDSDERKRAVAAFKRGELRQLVNVGLFTAGFDVPGVEVVTSVCPTFSLAKFLQEAGRGSRPADGKESCIYLDHAGNVYRHGLPDQDRDWSLDGVKKSRRKKTEDEEDEIKVKQCEGCFRPFWPPPKCPHCGHEHKVKAREIEQVDGKLEKISKEQAAAIQAAKKEEQRKARTLEELEAIEAERGYKPGWAKNIYNLRQNASNRRFEAQAEAYRR